MAFRATPSSVLKEPSHGGNWTPPPSWKACTLVLCLLPPASCLFLYCHSMTTELSSILQSSRPTVPQCHPGFRQLWFSTHFSQIHFAFKLDQLPFYLANSDHNTWFYSLVPPESHTHKVESEPSLTSHNTIYSVLTLLLANPLGIVIIRPLLAIIKLLGKGGKYQYSRQWKLTLSLQRITEWLFFLVYMSFHLRVLVAQHWNKALVI